VRVYTGVECTVTLLLGLRAGMFADAGFTYALANRLSSFHSAANPLVQAAIEELVLSTV
jgi:hypothetical protein